MGFLDWMKKWRNGGPEPKPDYPPIWERERQQEGKVVWTGDVYEHKDGESWAWVKKMPDGNFRPGITMFDESTGFETWATAISYEQKDSAISIAAKSFQEWREVHAPDMKLASPRIQNEIKDAYGLSEKESAPVVRNRDHGWDR
jgi:hypothetical protein